MNNLKVLRTNHTGNVKWGFEDWLYTISLYVFIVCQIVFINFRQITVTVQYLFIFIFSIRFYRKSSKFSLYSIWSLMYLLASLLSLFFSGNPNYSFYLILTIGQVLIFCNLVIPYLKENNKNFQYFINAIIISGMILAIRVLFQTPLSYWGMARIGAALNYNANTVGLVLSLSGCLAYFQFKMGKGAWNLLIFLALGFLSLFSGSRKAFTAILIFIIIINVIISKKTIKKFILNLIIGIFLISSLYYLTFYWEPLYNVLGVRLESLISGITGKETDDSTLTRLNMIYFGLEAFMKKPFFGYGLGAYNYISGYDSYSHNNYIEIAVSLGLFGFFIYYSLHIGILLCGLKQVVYNNRYINAYSILSFTIICVILFLDLGMVNFSDEFFQFLIVLSFSGLSGNRNNGKKNEIYKEI